MKQFKSKRLWSLLLALSLMLVACSGGGTTTTEEEKATTEAAQTEAAVTEAATEEEKTEEAATPAGGDRVQIQFWYAWTDTIAEANEEMAKMFNESQDKYEVIAEHQGSYKDVQSKLQAAMAANNAPGVAVIEPQNIQMLQKAGMIADISAGGIDQESFFPRLLENSIVDGKLYGIPYMRSSPILMINATMLEEAGLDPTGPKTWEDVIEIGKKFQEQSKPALTMSVVNQWYFESYLNQSGASIFNEDETDVNFNNEAGKKVLEYWRELQSNGYCNFLTGTDAGNLSKADFAAGATPMLVSTIADISYFLGVAEENGFELATAAMPIPEGGTQAVPTGGANLVVVANKSEEETQAAIDFLKFASQPENVAYVVEKTGYAPTTKAAVETEALQKLFAEKAQYEVSLSQLDFIQKRPNTEKSPEVLTAVTDMLTEFVIDPNADIDTLLSTYAEKCQQIINN
ncbi:MAG: ABC transporter substrate-binding protein [Tissierellia bacterium]|nr:ABC transporter substrate-binding protein [Tissierellia bacterium]